MLIANSPILITGGSQGLGRGIAEALRAQGASVTVVGRNAVRLRSVEAELGVATLTADVTDPASASGILKMVNPGVLVLNAGLPPPMAPIDSITWQDFTATWETDVRAGLSWVQAALNMPLRSGSRVLVTSSGAAIGGSPMSGGYGGAKRMLWFIAHYANALAEQRGLNIRFQTLIPRQMVAGTGTGDAGSHAYAAAMGVSPESFLERFGAPLTPRAYGERVVEILENPAYLSASALASMPNPASYNS